MLDIKSFYKLVEPTVHCETTEIKRAGKGKGKKIAFILYPLPFSLYFYGYLLFCEKKVLKYC
jgi:hypothetical protein